MSALQLTALVTGASSGIGACFAKSLSARGYHVILVARTASKLQALADRLNAGTPGIASVQVADLSQPRAARLLAQTLADSGVTVDLLINNAGFGAAGPFHKSDAARNQEMIAVNVQALAELCQEFLPTMVANRRGGIINVASAAAFQPLPGLALYAATKAFVLSLSEGLWAEVRGKGVTVTALCPGPVDTPFFEATGTPGLRSKVPAMAMMRPEAVVQAALAAHDARRSVAVPGLGNKFTSVLPRVMPRALMAYAAGRITGR
jgi:hypothetical protein